MSRRVLFVAYYFPPLGGGGVQRSAKFVRYLPEHGFEPVVITGPGPAGERWAPEDESVVADVPEQVPVLRVPGPVPTDGRPARSRLRKLASAPTPFDGWWSRGVLDRAGDADGVSLVYASMAPFSSAAPAAATARRLGVPWVADLRDPWAIQEDFAYPTALHWRVDRRRMRRVLASAAAIVLPTPGTLDRLGSSFPELRSRAVAIPNGYDPGEFRAPTVSRSDDLCHVVHAGNFYFHPSWRRPSGLRRLAGGTNLDVVHPSTPIFLLDAIDRILARQPEVGSRIRLHLVGPTMPWVDALVDRARCRALVERHGFLPHAQAVELMGTADVLFLTQRTLRPGVRTTIFPGKAYEYLASGRPILAAVPPGDARDVLDRAEWTVVCDPDDTEAIARGLLELTARRDGRRARNADRADLLRPFERPRLAGELARVFEAALP